MVYKTSVFTTVLACLGLILSAQAYCDDMELSLLGGVVSARDPDITSDENQSYSVNASSGSSALLIFNILQSDNYDGGSNYYELLLGSTQHDLLISSEGTQEKMDIEGRHYHIGGTYGFEPAKTVRPFFAMTIGLSEYESSNGNTDSFLSGSVGGGMKVDLTQRFALRVEARLLATLVEENTAIFCTNSGCAFAVEGDAWLQYQMNAGVTFKF